MAASFGRLATTKSAVFMPRRRSLKRIARSTVSRFAPGAKPGRDRRAAGYRFGAPRGRLGPIRHNRAGASAPFDRGSSLRQSRGRFRAGLLCRRRHREPDDRPLSNEWDARDRAEHCLQLQEQASSSQADRPRAPERHDLHNHRSRAQVPVPKILVRSSGRRRRPRHCARDALSGNFLSYIFLRESDFVLFRMTRRVEARLRGTPGARRQRRKIFIWNRCNPLKSPNSEPKRRQAFEQQPPSAVPGNFG